MNIEQFRARVAESAAAAQKAARHLSSLDEMAEKDEYVQSPNLNVRTKTKKGMGHESSSSSFSDANSSSEIPAVVEDFSTRFVDVISKAARPSPSRSGASSAASSKASSPRTQSPTLELTAKKTEIQTTKATLMPSVAAVYEQNGRKNATLQPKQKTKQQQQQSNKQHANAPKADPINEKHAFILQQLDYDSDSDSSNSDQSKDSHSQSRNALHEELEYELNECIANQVSLSNNIEKKDPNRFMKMAADLESEREALIANTAPTPKTIVPAYKDCEDGRGGLWGNNALRGGTAGEETNKALRAGLSWVQNVATPQLNAISQHILTKVADTSRTDNSSSGSASGPMIPSRSKLQCNQSDEENITVTTSSTFLSADEIAEFEQMRSKTSQSMISAMFLPLVEAIKSNQRLAFVVFTLLLSLFVYYYSRKRSVDDVL